MQPCWFCFNVLVILITFLYGSVHKPLAQTGVGSTFPCWLITSLCLCLWAVVLLASSHPVAFVQSKLSQENKGMASIPEGEPPNPEPATPNPKATAPSAAGTTDTDPDAAADAANTQTLIQDFKGEPTHPAISPPDQVTFEPDQEQTINSDTLHALVEQLRPPPSPAQSLEQIVIIRTVDNAEANPPQQWGRRMTASLWWNIFTF